MNYSCIYKILLTGILMIISCRLISQGKIFITPHIGFYSGSYSGVDSVNSKQNFIRSIPFLRKDFNAGIRISYLKERWGVSAGIESGNYSSGFKHSEKKSNPTRVVSKEALSQGDIKVLFTEFKYEAFDINVKKPDWLFKASQKEKLYMVASTIAPVLGFEYRIRGRTFVNDFHESSGFLTSQYSISGENWYHSYKKNHFSLRAGIDWTFYNLEKRKFILSFLYSFAFRDAGYFRYYFSKPGVADFHFQNTTKGNGFSIKAAVPIRIIEIKNKN